uniref:RNA binding protein n=1 Tax=Solanum tuberosum TaxID=4113 RepID=M1CKQ9_SOLTU
MAMLSESIKSIAFKKQQITKEFEKGDEVEVASQELGFIGSYYAATIICSTGDDYYRIKYKTLLTDDESEPLEDVFSAAEIRPVPPNQDETMSENGFRLYDMVDVFANDGWWFGFISAKVGDEYYVYFPTTGDNIAYPPHVLRFHQEWSYGKIKYKNLLTDDESAPLEEMFTSAAIRPVPPHQDETMSENGFRLYDMVDVFANDGWWFGFISGKIGEEYYVYFPTTADNIAYPRHVLRFHQEWFNGKWIVLPRQGKIFDLH